MSFVKDLDTPLLGVSPDDVFTCRDACGGVHVFGGIGAGKTFGSYMLAGAYLRAGMGGLVTASKFEEVELWQRYARKHGRASIGTVTECLMRVVDAARKASGTASQRGGEAFWEDAARQVLRYTLPALYAAKGSLSIPDIIRFISTAPANVKEPTEREWQKRSFMYEMMDRAARFPKVRMSNAAIANTITFWSEGWPAIPEKTRGNICITITAALDRFNHGRLNRAFCGKTTVVPELSFHGAVIVLAMPTLTWNEDGVIAQQLFKFMWQRAVLSRNSLEEKHRERFLFGWSDESQEVVNSYDYEFLSLCRASKCCVTYLTQSLPTYFAKIGGDNPKDATEALVGRHAARELQPGKRRERQCRHVGGQQREQRLVVQLRFFLRPAV